jgi:G3E family GTPase
MAAEAARLPVLLLTGALGSGKTTLLRHWLAQPALAGAAVVLNEVGAVELDPARGGLLLDAALPAAAPGPATPCLCCEGLPGLAEALEQLFWDRLHRRVARFDRVVVETAGHADPAPIARALRAHPLLAERYRLEGVIAVLHTMAATPAQVRAADVVVFSHADRRSPAQQARLRAAAQALQPAARCFDSAPHARAEPGPVLQALAARDPLLACLPDEDAPFVPRPWGRAGGAGVPG